MRQVRSIRYRDIAEQIRLRVAAGEFAVGRVLPSESELSATYGASRVTIRKALEALRTEGLVGSRQGFGWFVPGEAVRQPLAGLVTIEAQLEAEGRRSERRILDFAFTRPPAAVRAALGADETLTVRRLNLADGEPFALVTVWCPHELGSHLSRAQLAERTFHDLLPVSFGGATQTIGADAAEPDDAALLQIPPGSPVLKCTRVTRQGDGAPVLYAEYVFPAHRTEFTVDLATTEGTMAPGGIRLVE